MKHDDAFDALAALPPSRWNWHEKSLCRRIGLKATSDASSAHDELLSFVQAYENLDGRGTGDKSTGSKDAPSSNLTFDDIHVRYCQHGALEAFAPPKLDTREHVNVRPRWFQIGGATVPIKRQLAMIREIKGEDHRLDDATRQRRQSAWKSWATGSRGEDVSNYIDVDLRAIVFKYQKEIYGGDDEDGGAIESADELTRRELSSTVATTLREAMEMANQFPLRSTRLSEETVAAESLSPSRKRSLGGNATGNSPDAKRTCTCAPWPNISNLTDGGMPEAFRLPDLRDKARAEGLDGLMDIGRYELALRGVGEGKEASVINAELMECDLGLDLMSHDDIDFFANMAVMAKGRMMANIKALVQETWNLSPASQLFRRGDNQSLLDWISEGQRYTEGERLPTKLVVRTKETDRFFTDEAAHCVRHMIFTYGLSLSRFNGLMQCFSVMLCGRSIDLGDFVSTAELRCRIQRLRIVDEGRFFASAGFTTGKYLGYGYLQLWYTEGDDSKYHGNDKRHALLMTVDRGESIENFDPAVHSLTVGRAGLSNTDLNLSTINEKVPMDLRCCYGGNMSDNASDAVSEGKETFEGVMASVPEQERMLYGVMRQAITITDTFHIVNLACVKAVTGFAGPRDQDFKTRHRSKHHLQFEENIYDIHANNPSLSQHAADATIEGTDRAYVMRPHKERQTRWGANQENASTILQGMELPLPPGTEGVEEGANFWTRWGIYMHERSSSWVREASSDVIQDSMKKEVVSALHFERELGRHYMACHQWHAEVGELCSRPGFRTLELHYYLFDVLFPFWNAARTSPRNSVFKKTLQYVDDIDDDDVRKEMIERFDNAIDMGWAEVNKMMTRMLSAPLLYLVLSHPVRGPDLLNAAHRVLREDGKDLGEGFKPVDGDMTPGERRFYDLLKLDVEQSVHWFHQLGLARDVVRDDLRRLSSEVPTARVGGDKNRRLRDFREEYPVIFEALFAAFGLCPSSSRLVEQIHGIMRATLEMQTTLEFQDHRIEYLSDPEHLNRNKRRVVSRSARSESSKSKGSAKHEDRKETQKMVGDQLLESLQDYSAHAISKLPIDIKEKMKVKRVKEAGSLRAEEEAKSKAVEKAEIKKQKSKAKIIPFREWVDKAKKRKMDNYGKMKTKEDRQKEEDLRLVMTKSYWKDEIKLPERGRDRTPLYNETTAVLPYLIVPNLRSKTKKDLLPIIYAHIQAVKNISKGGANEISEETFEGKSEEEILRHFIKPKESLHLGAIQEDRKKKEEIRSALMISCGSDTSHGWVEMPFDLPE